MTDQSQDPELSLDATLTTITHIYKRICPSVGWLVGRLVYHYHTTTSTTTTTNTTTHMTIFTHYGRIVGRLPALFFKFWFIWHRKPKLTYRVKRNIHGCLNEEPIPWLVSSHWLTRLWLSSPLSSGRHIVWRDKNRLLHSSRLSVLMNWQSGWENISSSNRSGSGLLVINHCRKICFGRDFRCCRNEWGRQTLTESAL